MKDSLIDVNAYDFYVKDTPLTLIKKGWRSISSDDEILELVFPIYKDEKRPLVFCRMVWCSSDKPLSIDVYANNTLYPTFFREKYNSSHYIKKLHRNILREINKLNAIAKRKDSK